MFIKNIIISGFRSYRELSFPDGLSPKTNVIVGKNGSGKSNFFAAIQFVLSERYANLRPAERKELFHQGSGRPALSIFVEIVFDNCDGRLVIPGRAEEKEVRIRRTVGLKQDEFRVNDRKFTATEVHQLMESAGFSSSNPYYVVEQGKVVHLANMSEEDRYHLIKEVAGTKVYENRRAESERILADTEVKQKQIDGSINQLADRLKDLEAETAELKEFQEVDREKKCVEYCIFNTELDYAKAGIIKLEAEWNANVSQLNKNQDSQSVSEQEIQACEARVADVKARLARLENEKVSIEKEVSALNSRQAVMEVDATDAAGRMSRIEREQAALGKELAELEKALLKSKENAVGRRKKFQANEAVAKKSLAEVEEQQTTVERMQERRNRTKLFKNRSQRDEWISSEVDSNTQAIHTAKSGLDAVDKEIAEIDTLIHDEAKKIKDTTTSTDNVERDICSREKKIAAAVARRNELNQDRRQRWQAIHEQENTVQRLDEALQGTRRHLERTIRHDIRQGLQSLKEVLADMKPNIRNAVHGPLIDLISVEDGFGTAVEVTSGNALFNVVVDSFDISAALLEKMNKERKPGRISFFPIDTIRATPKAIPTTATCSSLISKITFERKFSGVVAEVFGRTAVTTSLEGGTALVKEIQCDVVTLDGDQLGRKGGITGGYIDRRNMKLPAYAKEKQLTAERIEKRKRLEELCQEVAGVEQSITEVLNELEILRNQNISTEKKADDNLREARQREDRVNRLRTRKDNLDATKISLQKNVESCNDLIKRLKEEMKGEFKSTWSPAEEAALEKLTDELAKKKNAAASLQAAALRLATDAQLLEDTVQHLERRKAVVEGRLREIGWTKRATNDVDREHASVNSEFASFMERLSAIEKAVEAATKERQKHEAQLEYIVSSRISSAMSLQERKDVVDRSQAQRSLLMQRRDDALQKMRKLGVVPRGVEKLAGFSMGKLMHQLKLVNEKANTFAHVNRKALDQHTALLETKNDLQSQRDNLNKELKSIYELMDHLDRKKDEAIERTYKQIQYQFEEVFKELVSTNGSSAELQLVKRNSGSDNANGDDPYLAARIRVSFGVGAPISELQQLSGGQKSLVALAFIFAIQRCDPAPFYLFDEIDAALDAEYRTAVARVLEKQSEECQFIVATFKTELLSVADRVLGIFFHNKVSRIQTIAMEEGVRLLKQAAIEDRKRGREETEEA